MSRKQRVLLVLVCGVGLIGVAAAYVEFHFHLPVGRGPAAPTVGRTPFDSIWTDRKVLLLGLGDSVTAGFGATRGLSYFDRLASNPPDDFPDMQRLCLSRVLPNLTTLNIAVSGSNSIDHERAVQVDIPTQPPDVFGIVVMTSGGNDLIHWYGRTAPREGRCTVPLGSRSDRGSSISNGDWTRSSQASSRSSPAGA